MKVAMLLMSMLVAMPAFAAIDEGTDPGESEETAVSGSPVAIPGEGSAVKLPTDDEIRKIEGSEKVDLPEVEEGKSRLDPTAGPKRKSRYRASNFVLGALGGALIGGYLGFIQSAGPEGVREDDARLFVPLYSGLGLAGGGLLGLLMGALVAPDPTPPTVALPASDLHAPIVSLWAGPQGAQIGLRLDF